MREIWTKSKAEYHGQFVNFDPMMTWPKPVQKPHPPVIVGGVFPHGAKRAPPWRIACGDLVINLADQIVGRPRRGVHALPSRGPDLCASVCREIYRYHS